MPLSKQGLAAEVEKANRTAVEKMCGDIDAELKAKWNPVSRNAVYINVDSLYSAATQQVIQLYKSLGWDVEPNSSQRDGSWLTFK